MALKFESNIKTGRPFINYAHRGASEYVPENTMLAFSLGITMGANGIETDVQKSKDGVLILFHDDTLDRVTGKSGSVSDYTLSELKSFSVNKNGILDKIVTLEEFLIAFAKKKIHFAIELKSSGFGEEVVDMIKRYNAQNYSVITSFDYDALKEVKNYDKTIRLGYLTWQIDDNLLKKMKADGFYEICPRDDFVTKENVKLWHDLGFNVRAWNIKNEDIMKRVYDNGADGMTVNFPDKLVDYIASKIST